jgi:hypothetical protein
MLGLQAAAPCRLEVGGERALRFAEFQHIRVGVVLTGSMWLTPHGRAPIRLGAGDCYLLATGLPYTIGSEPHRRPDDGTAVFRRTWPDTVFHNIAPGDLADTSPTAGCARPWSSSTTGPKSRGRWPSWLPPPGCREARSPCTS